MMMSIPLQVLGLVILITRVRQTLTCSCLKPPSQTQFCESDIVLRGTVINETKIMDPVPPEYKGWDLEFLFLRERVYDVEVANIFRKLSGFEVDEDNFTKVSTAGNSGLCGQELTVGGDYLISGIISGDKISISSCDWIQEFGDVSEFNRVGLNGQFDCDCQIRFGRRRIPKNNKKGFCKLHSPSPYWAPDPNEYCKKNPETGKCGWATQQDSP